MNNWDQNIRGLEERKRIRMERMNEEIPGIKSLVMSMEESKYTAVLTGAGMDTESNIPDFRSKTGWWRNLDPRKVASVEALNNHYPLFHEFYSMRIKALENCNPHQGHYILSTLEKKGVVKSILTQNVSGLHEKAGCKSVFELHGNIERIRCNQCDHIADVNKFIKGEYCSKCGEKTLRPDITLFGEMLPENAWNNAIREVEKSDLLIVIGTSLEVYPANQLPSRTKGKVIFINAENTSAKCKFDLEIIGKAKRVLEEVYYYLR